VIKELRLALSVKAVNDCVGPEGLVPSLLVFGVMPRLPDFPLQVPSQIERSHVHVLLKSPTRV
jgi:hypothetical protein